MPTLTLITNAGKNKHGQRLVTVQCSCGSAPFICREDSFKQGHTKSCGCTRSIRKLKTASVTQSVQAVFVDERTAASFDEIIAAKECAALSADKRAHALEQKMSSQDSTDLDTHKAWNTESATARKLRQEIARLKVARDKAANVAAKTGKTHAQTTREIITQLQNRNQ